MSIFHQKTSVEGEKDHIKEVKLCIHADASDEDRFEDISKDGEKDEEKLFWNLCKFLLELGKGRGVDRLFKMGFLLKWGLVQMPLIALMDFL